MSLLVSMITWYSLSRDASSLFSVIPLNNNQPKQMQSRWVSVRKKCFPYAFVVVIFLCATFDVTTRNYIVKGGEGEEDVVVHTRKNVRKNIHLSRSHHAFRMSISRGVENKFLVRHTWKLLPSSSSLSHATEQSQSDFLRTHNKLCLPACGCGWCW